MSPWPDALTALVEAFGRLPGIGEKTATRLALHVVSEPSELSERLAASLRRASSELRHCVTCGNLTESERCSVCLDPRRDTSLLCIVQGYADLVAIERTGEFAGRYHVLHGVIRPLDGVGPEALNLSNLVERVREEGVEEVIVATSPSVEGEATAMYVRNALEPLGVPVSRIARGLPMGSEVEYADRATLGRALAAREKL